MIEEILGIVRLLAGNPAGNIELGAIVLLSVVACVGVVDKVTRSFKFPLTGTNRAAGLVLGGIVIGIVIVAAANLYIMPRVKTESLQPLVPIVAGSLAFLAIAGPAACFLFRGPYLKSLLVMLLGVAAAAALSLVLRAGIQAVRSGGKDFEKTRQRTQKVNQVL